MTDQRDPSRDALMQGIGELKGGMQGIAGEVRELRANAVTKEVLEAKIGPMRSVIYGLIAIVLTTVALAVVGGVLDRDPVPVPKVEVIIPTAPPPASPAAR